MPKISKECLNGALEALKHFSKEDLEDYVTDVFKKAREYGDLNNMKAFEEAIKNINNEKMQSLFEDASVKANNTRKFNTQAEKIKSGKADLRSVLIRRRKNQAENIASAQHAAIGKIDQFMFKDFSFDEMEFFSSTKNDELIADAFDGKKVSNPIAKKIADKLREYFDYRNSEIILSNAMRIDEISEDRMFRQIHDAGRLISGGKSLINSVKESVNKKYSTENSKVVWRNFIKRWLDIENTFSRTKAADLDGKINEAKVDKILDNIYENITTGKSEIFTRSVVANDREAVQRRSRMFFKFKDMRSFLEYNKVYGRGNLFSALRSDIQGSGNKIGMAETFGDSPYNVYNDLRKVQEEVKPKDSYWFQNTDNYFKTVLGLDKTTRSPKVSTFFANIRALTSMARLVKLSLQSISDIGYIASFAQRMGVNYFRAYTNQLKHIFDRYPTEERKYIAKLFKTMVDSHLGYMGRWSDANNMGEVMNKASTRYFKTIGLEAFDRGNKVGIMHLMSKHLYENSSKEFGSLNSSLQKWILKFMNEKEWNVLKTKNKNLLFTTDNVEELTEQELKQLRDETNPDKPLYEYKNDLYRKVYSMFDVASENAVLSPTEFERAWCFQGEPPGTLKGEFLRTISQFKMYTISYIDRVLINGFKEADTASQKITWATSMLMGTLPLAFLSVYLDNLTNNLSMPDFELMNVPEREKFLVSLLAPSLALFSGMLDPRNQNSDMLLSLLGSPSARLIGNAMATAASLSTGDPKKIGKHFEDTAKYILPIDNFPGISPVIKKAMGKEAHLQPGQTYIIGQ